MMIGPFEVGSELSEIWPPEMQYIGLKDKSGLQEVYEHDIINNNGEIKGNIYQMDKGKTDFVIQGFGTKNWCKTYKEAIYRGCKDAE